MNEAVHPEQTSEYKRIRINSIEFFNDTSDEVGVLRNVLIAGISGAIGSSIARELIRRDPEIRVFGLCRQPDKVSEEVRIARQVCLIRWDAEKPGDADEMRATLARALPYDTGLDCVIFAVGVLHGGGTFPEKRLEDLETEAFLRSIQVNASSFGMLVKSLLPWLRHKFFKRIVAISAKVGSISDNRFGGWYAYRSSKAALNMLVKTLSVELPRRCKPVVCVAVHPGTTRSALSEPFSRSLQQLEVHSPHETALHILAVVDDLDESRNGCFLNWDGEELRW